MEKNPPPVAFQEVGSETFEKNKKNSNFSQFSGYRAVDPIYGNLIIHKTLTNIVVLTITQALLLLYLEKDKIEDSDSYLHFEWIILIVTYRLKDWLSESGSKVGIAQFETLKNR